MERLAVAATARRRRHRRDRDRRDDHRAVNRERRHGRPRRIRARRHARRGSRSRRRLLARSSRAPRQRQERGYATEADPRARTQSPRRRRAPSRAPWSRGVASTPGRRRGCRERERQASSPGCHVRSPEVPRPAGHRGARRESAPPASHGASTPERQAQTAAPGAMPSSETSANPPAIRSAGEGAGDRRAPRRGPARCASRGPESGDEDEERRPAPPRSSSVHEVSAEARGGRRAGPSPRPAEGQPERARIDFLLDSLHGTLARPHPRRGQRHGEGGRAPVGREIGPSRTDATSGSNRSCSEIARSATRYMPERAGPSGPWSRSRGPAAQPSLAPGSARLPRARASRFPRRSGAPTARATASREHRKLRRQQGPGAPQREFGEAPVTVRAPSHFSTSALPRSSPNWAARS